MEKDKAQPLPNLIGRKNGEMVDLPNH